MLTASGMKIMNKMGKCVCMVNYTMLYAESVSEFLNIFSEYELRKS